MSVKIPRWTSGFEIASTATRAPAAEVGLCPSAWTGQGRGLDRVSRADPRTEGIRECTMQDVF